MPSEIAFVGKESFKSAVLDADKLFIVAPAAAIKDGGAFELMRISKEPLAVSCCLGICTAVDASAKPAHLCANPNTTISKCYHTGCNAAVR